MIVAALSVSLAAFVVALLGVGVGYLGLRTAQETPPPSPEISALQESHTGLLQRVQDLENKPERNLEPLTEWLEEVAERMDKYERDLEEGLDVARRREARLRQALRRTETKLEEEGVIDPGYQAAATEIRGINGAGSEAEGVPPVSDDLEDDAPSSIPGVTREQLMSARMG